MPNAGPAYTAAVQITSLATACKLLFAKNKIHQITAEHQITSKDPPIQSVECLIKDTAPVKPALISTSAFPAKVNTPGPSVQEGKLPLVSPYGKAPLRPLTLECESSLTQVHLSMTSESTLLNSELILPTYSRPLDHVYDLPCDVSTSQLPIFSPKHDSLPNDCYLSETRSLLIECESDPSLEVSPNERHLTPDLAPSKQKLALPKHTAATIDHLPIHLQQFLIQQRINFNDRTPLRALALQEELATHPDQAFVHNLIHNIQSGCNIGYAGPQFSHCNGNLPSAYQQPSILDSALAQECKEGRILGPFDTPPLPSFRCSGLGLVPKHDGGWRTIYHLSAPHGDSINDYINPETYSLSYCSVDNAYAILNLLGTGALMSKIDLKNAFRLIPVHPNDWNLLGICWRHKFYIDTCLPFGLRSAPFLFNQLSIAIHWILQHKYSVRHLLHYLDDFFTAGAPGTSECQENLDAMLSL